MGLGLTFGANIVHNVGSRFMKNQQRNNPTTLEKVYQTPEGEEIKINDEQFIAHECLFQPYMIGKEIDALHESIIEAISSCDMNLHRDLYNNIILTGGSSNFPGLKERLKQEISKNLPQSINVNIYTNPESDLSPWIGGSIVGSLPSFSQIAVTKEQYIEHGYQYSN